MMLADVIDAYLTRQRSLGMRFDSAGQLLHRFGRAIGNRPIEEVTPEAILDFLNALTRHDYPANPDNKTYYTAQQIRSRAEEAGFRRSSILGEPNRRVLLLLAER